MTTGAADQQSLRSLTVAARYEAAFRAATVRERWSRAAAVLAVALLAVTLPARAEIIDRIAVSVGNRVIAESDLHREIRVAAFLDGVKPDFSPAGQRATAERMVEQVLIRRELEISRYPVPSAAEVAPVFEAFQKERFPKDEEYQRALADYGIADGDVKDLLLWQRTLLLFIEVRFQSGVQVTGPDIQDYFDKVVQPAAEAAHPGQPIALEEYRDRIEQTIAGQRADREMNTWLKESRNRTGIVFHDEVFR
jgi:peptidyl-prolyl cis-trans isomerase SurA